MRLPCGWLSGPTSRSCLLSYVVVSQPSKRPLLGGAVFHGTELLITALKQDYTIVIVTHNMQQATRVSTRTAFFYLGELIEYGETAKIFGNPSEKQTEDYVTGRFG